MRPGRERTRPTCCPADEAPTDRSRPPSSYSATLNLTALHRTSFSRTYISRNLLLYMTTRCARPYAPQPHPRSPLPSTYNHTRSRTHARARAHNHPHPPTNTHISSSLSALQVKHGSNALRTPLYDAFIKAGAEAGYGTQINS